MVKPYITHLNSQNRKIPMASTENVLSQLDTCKNNGEFNSKAPSDIGLLHVSRMVSRWESLAISLGLPIDIVQQYESKPHGELKALQYWRNGNSGSIFPPTWGFLLKQVEATSGKAVARAIRREAEMHPTFSQSGPGSVSQDAVAKMNGPVSDLTPSDEGLLNACNMIPEWQILAICLGVPYDVIQSNTPAPLGGLAALAYWRNGYSGKSYPSTWKFLLEKVDDRFGSVVAEAIAQKASMEPNWTVEVKDSLRQASESSFIPRKVPYGHIKAKDVIKSFTWRKMTNDIKDMLTITRAKILERDYFLIDPASSAAIRADLEKGDQDSAATRLIEYFERNHNGDDMLRFCTFLKDEAEESKSSALKDLASRIERAVKQT